MSGHQEEVEMGDLENDAFLPNHDWVKKSSKDDSIFIRWLPNPIRGIVKNLSRMKVSKPDVKRGVCLLIHHVIHSSCSCFCVLLLEAWCS